MLTRRKIIAIIRYQRKGDKYVWFQLYLFP